MKSERRYRVETGWAISECRLNASHSLGWHSIGGCQSLARGGKQVDGLQNRVFKMLLKARTGAHVVGTTLRITLGDRPWPPKKTRHRFRFHQQLGMMIHIIPQYLAGGRKIRSSSPASTTFVQSQPELHETPSQTNDTNSYQMPSLLKAHSFLHSAPIVWSVLSL